jgi:hypothetical protein
MTERRIERARMQLDFGRDSAKIEEDLLAKDLNVEDVKLIIAAARLLQKHSLSIRVALTLSSKRADEDSEREAP